MSDHGKGERRRFKAHESARAHALNGLPLALFWQRAAGYFIDLFLAILVWVPLEVAWRYYILHEEKIELSWDFHEKGNVVVILLYWGIANYLGNGQTPGKWAPAPEPSLSTASGSGSGSPWNGLSATEPPSLKEVLASCSSFGTTTACAHRIVSRRLSSWT